MGFFYFICIIIIGTIFYNKLKSKITSLKQELILLQRSLKLLNTEFYDHLKKLPQSSPKEVTQKTTHLEAASGQTSFQKGVEIPETPNTAYKQPKPSITASQSYPIPSESLKKSTIAMAENLPKKKLKEHKLWKKFETQLSENLTGIIGSLVMVLGVVFLGVYAAIKLGPLGRFGVFCLFSTALYALYAFLNTKSFWRNISLWVRSI